MRVNRKDLKTMIKFHNKFDKNRLCTYLFISNGNRLCTTDGRAILGWEIPESDIDLPKNTLLLIPPALLDINKNNAFVEILPADNGIKVDDIFIKNTDSGLPPVGFDVIVDSAKSSEPCTEYIGLNLDLMYEINKFFPEFYRIRPKKGKFTSCYWEMSDTDSRIKFAVIAPLKLKDNI